MTERQLFNAIGEIDEGLVAEAAQVPAPRSLRWLAAVAALVVAAGAVITFFAVREQKTPPAEPVDPSGITAATEVTETTAATEPTAAPTEATSPLLGPDGLPLLSLEGLTDTGGMGGYGYVYAGSFEEIFLSQVWEDAPETLPVWQMEQTYFAGDYTLQVELIRRVAEAMGDPIPENAEINSFRGSDSPDAIGGRSTWMDTDRYRYEVNSDHGYLTVMLNQPLNMGKQRNWLKEIQGAFPGLFADMKTPVIQITGGDRLWEAGEDGAARATEPLWTLHIYDAADPEGKCAAFLKGVQASVWDSGRVESVCVYLPEYYEKLGDYPVLTREQAQAALEAEYSPCRVLGAELIYEGLSLSRLRAPVWRFLLEDEGQNGPSLSVPGTTAFAEIFLPAIPPAYLAGEQNGETAPTGYPNGEMQCEMLFFEGTLFARDFSVDPVPAEKGADPSFTLVGRTSEEINDRPPGNELSAARVPVGTPVYRDPQGRLWLLTDGRMLCLQ